MSFQTLVALALGTLVMMHATGAVMAAAIGETKVLKWKDGKQAAFLLQFDDSCVSHVEIAIPELEKRGMVGTFYINPGNGSFQGKKDAWEKAIPAAGMEYGNHTHSLGGKEPGGPGPRACQVQ